MKVQIPEACHDFFSDGETEEGENIVQETSLYMDHESHRAVEATTMDNNNHQQYGQEEDVDGNASVTSSTMDNDE